MRVSRRQGLVGLLLFSFSAMAGGVALSVFRETRSEETPGIDAILALNFENAQRKTVSLADFQGKAILLNVWATWCAPCRKEMPSLDRLQATMGSSQFEVVALSIDRTGLDVVTPFFTEIGIKNLDIYLDKPAAVMRRAAVIGLPTTLLIDGQGRELHRWVGPKEWDSAEAIEEIRGYLGGGASPSATIPQ